MKKKNFEKWKKNFEANILQSHETPWQTPRTYFISKFNLSHVSVSVLADSLHFTLSTHNVALIAAHPQADGSGEGFRNQRLQITLAARPFARRIAAYVSICRL
jgi:hypothetical protein